MNAPRRKYLSNFNGWGARRKVYEVPGGLEIDELDQYDITRKRVFFDDVVYVTYHRYYGKAFLWLMGLTGGFFTFVAYLAWSDRSPEGATALMIIALLFLVPMALRLLLMVDCITIYGKRSKAQLHFSFRKARAREVYKDLIEKIRQTQERLGAEIAAEQAQQEADAPARPPQEAVAFPLPPAVPPSKPAAPAAATPPTLIPPTQ